MRKFLLMCVLVSLAFIPSAFALGDETVSLWRTQNGFIEPSGDFDAHINENLTVGKDLTFEMHRIGKE